MSRFRRLTTTVAAAPSGGGAKGHAEPGSSENLLFRTNRGACRGLILSTTERPVALAGRRGRSYRHPPFRCRISGFAAGSGVGVGGDLGGGLLAELDVAAEAGEVLVPGLGLELGGGAAVDGQVLERGVPQLVERPAVLVRVESGGGLLEQVFGARVGQPSAPGLGADVGGRGGGGARGRGAPAGEKHRAGGAA